MDGKTLKPHDMDLDLRNAKSITGTNTEFVMQGSRDYACAVNVSYVMSDSYATTQCRNSLQRMKWIYGGKREHWELF
jgi:hypothetical protein